MQDLQATVTYFAEAGPQNTEVTFERAAARAKDLSIEYVVVASDTGKTARRALEAFPKPMNVVVVTNPANLRLPVAKLHDYLPRFKELKERLLAEGVEHVHCSLGAGTAAELEAAGAVVRRIDWKQLQTFTRVGLGSLDRVGVGVRVGLTIATWATMSRALPPDVDVIAISGTGFGGGGADTAIVVRTATAWSRFRVLETIARPRVSPPSELPG